MKVWLDMPDVLWRYRQMTWHLTRSLLIQRYRGSLLGLFWTLVQPLLMLGIYSFVFGAIFRPRWMEAGSEGSFALILFCGLTAYGFFAESLGRAPAYELVRRIKVSLSAEVIFLFVSRLSVAGCIAHGETAGGGSAFFLCVLGAAAAGKICDS